MKVFNQIKTKLNSFNLKNEIWNKMSLIFEMEKNTIIETKIKIIDEIYKWDF